ncbi:MAG: hypothetical protein ACYC2U_00265 [Candidatus Amoebophilus sp.]
MPTNNLDFYLSTCEGLHEFMWQTTASIINWVISICWKAFPFCLFIRLASDEATNRYNGVIDFKVHLKTIYTAILIAYFLANYKRILESFDEFINIFHFSEPESLKIMGKSAPEAQQTNDSLPWYKNITDRLSKEGNIILQYLSDQAAGYLSAGAYKIHKAFIYIMHYAKVYLLLLTALIGPIAAVGTLLPTFIRTNFSTWARSYFNIACWGIVLNIFKAFAEAHRRAAESSSGFIDTGAYTFSSAILVICILLTPTITSQFIGSAITPNLANIAHHATTKGSKLLSRSIGGLTKGVAKTMGGVSRGVSKGIAKTVGAAMKGFKK